MKNLEKSKMDYRFLLALDDEDRGRIFHLKNLLADRNEGIQPTISSILRLCIQVGTDQLFERIGNNQFLTK